MGEETIDEARSEPATMAGIDPTLADSAMPGGGPEPTVDDRATADDRATLGPADDPSVPTDRDAPSCPALTSDETVDASGAATRIPGPRTDAAVRGLPEVPGYELVSLLGRGGMGVVYQARQIRLNRPCALKMVLAGGHAGPESLLRFFTEAEAVAKLHHPNVVQIYHLGEADGLPFFEMEYLEGGSLDHVLDGSPWTPIRAARMIATVARGVAAAHRLGIVHRDLKPGNILLADNGTPKVSDFGLAKSTGSELGLTGTGVVVGSPSYMAPEQAEGQAGQVGPPADVYALGVILYELLTGRPPFRGATPIDTIHQVRTAEPVPPSRLVPNLPRDLETVVLKCLEKPPARRYPDAAELADELDRFLAGKPIRARSISKAERAWRWCLRNRAVAGLLAALATVLVAGFAGMTILWIRAESLRDLAEARTAEAVQQREALRDEREATRRRNYFSEMHLAHQAWSEERGTARMREILAHWATPGDRDLRGWEWYYLDGLLHQEVATLSTGRKERGAVSWSRDGAFLAATGDAFTVKVWDARTMAPAASLTGHSEIVTALAWSPDGRRLATASGDGTVRVWDRTKGFASTVLAAGAPLEIVAWSPDGARIVAAANEGSVFVWPSAGGEPSLFFKESAPLKALSWSPDGTRLASGSGGGLRIRDVSGASASPASAFGTDGSEILAIDWSPDGSRIAAGEAHTVVRVWDAATSKGLHVLRGHTRAVEGVRWSNDGTRLASASADNLVKVWDPATGVEIRTLRGHDAAIHSVAWSPDYRLASAGQDATVRVWDVSKDGEVKVVRGFNDRATAMAWSPDGRMIAAADEDGSIELLDPKTGRLRSSLREGRSWIFGLAWSPDGARLASSSGDGKVKVWDVAAGKVSREFRSHLGPAMAVAWSPDGARIASTGHDGSIQVRDARTGTRMHMLRNGKPVNDLRWSPDGARIAAAVRDGKVRIWSADDGRPLLAIDHGAEARGVAWSPDGTRLASAGNDGLIHIWDPSGGRKLATLRGHSDWCFSVSWNRDGSRLASSGADRVVRVWDPVSGLETLVLRSHTDVIASAAWSPDGLGLASSSYDGSVRIWDASPGYSRNTAPDSRRPESTGR
jgi:eukaryotic-like serine/threonine-protein kinase